MAAGPIPAGSRVLALVHGATGFTGKLVCDALARRGIRFAVSGRNRDKLERVAALVGAAEVCVVDLGAPESIRSAVEGRAIVCACAGPFVAHGEPILASCARMGVDYVDTTGEQDFVANAVSRYRPTAEASGACVVPAMAYEIALADWAAHLAAERIGGAPDALAILYAHGSGTTTRGTKKSALALVADGTAKQFVGGELVVEAPASEVREFSLRATKRVVTGMSFPSPEAIVVPSHTGARTVRTFMATSPMIAAVARAGRAFTPALARFARSSLERAIDRSSDGPDGAARASSHFEILCEATKGERRVSVSVSGRDPYGLTAEIQAYAVERALARELTAKGVVAPSVAFAASTALEALVGLDGFAVKVQ